MLIGLIKRLVLINRLIILINSRISFFKRVIMLINGLTKFIGRLVIRLNDLILTLVFYDFAILYLDQAKISVIKELL